MKITAYLVHALPVDQRRVFNRKEAASYIGVSPGLFSNLVRKGIMPNPLPSFGRARRWDKASLDRALDASVGITGSGAPLTTAYDQWKATNG
ncbi:hypothetical protein NIM87_13375 [Devosia sp. XJ19-1]|uniref:Helix-turn-helix domain-containing protein n=1 Tax=Devosia ureilytica TaxID=2952754 RepID=A0A9Q4AQP9_9HYPH|nr:hypothetical protein [Devosia ureilytica]MCP8884504.1 hypothetical protein [Devosia ureilytica]MCP8888134.1 hypothetical protein [Devosia ureilytica]